jgi:uncharacterized protein YciW
VDEVAQNGLLEALRIDHRLAVPDGALVNEGDLAILDYALKLTRTPGEMKLGDVEKLREAGLDDRGVHDLCAIVGYFAFVNRIADGLGVELE